MPPAPTPDDEHSDPAPIRRWLRRLMPNRCDNCRARIRPPSGADCPPCRQLRHVADNARVILTKGGRPPLEQRVYGETRAYREYRDKGQQALAELHARRVAVARRSLRGRAGRFVDDIRPAPRRRTG
ncbi:hypothetical protein QYS60_11225 [Rhodococcus sp. GXMU-t2271]|uniref:hypothetical protein n=1 Tax=Rhodococcus sp. GXMU-t2271 TaxID=3059079 RepID=UPI00352AF825